MLHTQTKKPKATKPPLFPNGEKTKEVTHSAVISFKQNDVYYQELFELDGKKLRINIRSNSYDFQCSATIWHWTGVGIDKEWKVLGSINAGSMQTEEALYVYDRQTNGKGDINWFVADIKTLKDQARFILGIK